MKYTTDYCTSANVMIIMIPLSQSVEVEVEVYPRKWATYYEQKQDQKRATKYEQQINTNDKSLQRRHHFEQHTQTYFDWSDFEKT